MSKTGERYGPEVFQQSYQRIVELCTGAGLVWGEELCMAAAGQNPKQLGRQKLGFYLQT